MDNLSKYVPNCYVEVRELKTIYDVETIQLGSAEDLMFQVFYNYFVQKCDSDTLASWEETLDIVPDPNDDLETRRQRVLFAIATTSPYTDAFLREMLNRYTENATIDIDSVNCKLTITIVENDLSLAIFLKKLLIPIIPAHFSFDLVVGLEYTIEHTSYVGTATSVATIYNVGG